MLLRPDVLDERRRELVLRACLVAAAKLGIRPDLPAAEVISGLGTRMTYLALPGFVLVTTGSAGRMSLVLAAEIAPMAILGIPGGTLVQRIGDEGLMSQGNSLIEGGAAVAAMTGARHRRVADPVHGSDAAPEAAPA